MPAPIIDSGLVSLEEAIRGRETPIEIRNALALVTVSYVSFDGRIHVGQLVVAKELEEEVKELFKALLHMGFPIAKVIPIVRYDWDDEASMAANNTSAFNYRLILGTKRLSNHSFGRAIDINPMQNPYYARDGKVHPAGATYDTAAPGTLVKGGDALGIFKKKGWMWGGDWTVPVDFQHLEKPAP